MPKKNNRIETCPICGTEAKVSNRAWFYTCTGCGSGINLIGIWWKDRSGKDWMDLTETLKRQAGDEFFKRSHVKKWKNEVLII